jgi:hypothetical protein
MREVAEAIKGLSASDVAQKVEIDGFAVAPACLNKETVWARRRGTCAESESQHGKAAAPVFCGPTTHRERSVAGTASEAAARRFALIEAEES